MLSVSVPDCCTKSREILVSVKDCYVALNDIVPKNEYYRYNDHWRYLTQQLSFLVSFIVFLESGLLVSRAEFADLIGG